MGSPTQTNSFAQLVVDIISGLIEGVGAQALEATAEIDIPLLAAPVIKQVFEFVVEKELAKISIGVEQGAVTIIFNIQTDNEVSRAIKATLALKAAKAKGDPNEIKQADDDADKAYQDLIHWDGTVSLH